MKAKGDKPATISREAQQRQVVTAIVELMEELGLHQMDSLDSTS